MLTLRAPGKRVLEVGCGTGLLSCVAARLGAEHVFAIEPTALVNRARAMVTANGLDDKVTVLEGLVQDFEPRPVDLVFSELLNADPFFEGVVPAMDSAAQWLVPGGRLSPRRLKVYVALAWASEPSEEFESREPGIRRICSAHGLQGDVLHETLDVWHPMRFVTHAERPVSTVACAFDFEIGTQEPAPDLARIAVQSRVDGAVGGARSGSRPRSTTTCGCRTRRAPGPTGGRWSAAGPGPSTSAAGRWSTSKFAASEARSWSLRSPDGRSAPSRLLPSPGDNRTRTLGGKRWRASHEAPPRQRKPAAPGC